MASKLTVAGLVSRAATTPVAEPVSLVTAQSWPVPHVVAACAAWTDRLGASATSSAARNERTFTRPYFVAAEPVSCHRRQGRINEPHRHIGDLGRGRERSMVNRRQLLHELALSPGTDQPAFDPAVDEQD